MSKKLLVLALFLGITLGALVFKVQQAQAISLPKVNICHCEGNECNTLNISVAGAIGHITQHDDDYYGECEEEPEVTPTPTPTITPTPTEVPEEEECEEGCELTPTPTLQPEDNREVELTTKGFELGGPPQSTCEAPVWAPTLTYNGTNFVWTEVKDGVNSYWLDYGPTQDNLPYSVLVEGETFMPNVGWSGHIWARVAASDQGCLGPFSLTVDP